MPFADPNVKVWISRDCDSRLSWRERAAVDEWLETDKACHLMRDSHNHSYTMMAGMFGINNELFFERYGMLNLQNPGSENREDDQTILERAVFRSKTITSATITGTIQNPLVSVQLKRVIMLIMIRHMVGVVSKHMS